MASYLKFWVSNKGFWLAHQLINSVVFALSLWPQWWLKNFKPMIFRNLLLFNWTPPPSARPLLLRANPALTAVLFNL